MLQQRFWRWGDATYQSPKSLLSVNLYMPSMGSGGDYGNCREERMQEEGVGLHPPWLCCGTLGKQRLSTHGKMEV